MSEVLALKGQRAVLSAAVIEHRFRQLTGREDATVAMAQHGDGFAMQFAIGERNATFQFKRQQPRRTLDHFSSTLLEQVVEEFRRAGALAANEAPRIILPAG